MNTRSFYFYCSLATVVVSCSVAFGAESEDKDPSPDSFLCTKEELISLFPTQVVRSVLLKGGLPKEQASTIAMELSHKDRELARKIEERTERLNSGDFKEMTQRELAFKIYRETLYEVFASTLKSHGITNEEKIQALLDAAQTAKSKLFVECIRRQQPNSPPTTPGERDSKG